MKARQDGYSHFKGVEVGGEITETGNGVTITSAVTGAGPTIAVVGDDSNADLTISPKGTGRFRTTEAVGAKNGSTVTATEYGIGPVHQTLLTLAATPLTMTDAAQGAGVKIYDFPEGRILVLGATGTMAFTTTSTLASTLNASVTANWGVGTVVQVNGTLATTEQNLIPTTNCTASATINVAGSTTSAPLAVSAQFEGTTTPVDAYLNIGVATSTDIDGDATVTATGTVNLTWIKLGDY